MHRRGLIASAGTALFMTTAGCIGSGNGNGNGDDTTPDVLPRVDVSMGTTADLAGGSLTLSDPIVQQRVVTEEEVFHTIEQHDGMQFITLDVTSEVDVAPGDFALEIDGELVEPPAQSHAIHPVVRSVEGTGIAIPIETDPVDSVGVAFRPGTEVQAVWELSSADLDLIELVPDPRLFDPVIVEEDGQLAIEVIVVNAGDRDGPFLALVMPDWVVDLTIPVGFNAPRATMREELIPLPELGDHSPDDIEFVEEPRGGDRHIRLTLAD